MAVAIGERVLVPIMMIAIKSTTVSLPPGSRQLTATHSSDMPN
jgi:hypothetical protein